MVWIRQSYEFGQAIFDIILRNVNGQGMQNRIVEEFSKLLAGQTKTLHALDIQLMYALLSGVELDYSGD